MCFIRYKIIVFVIFVMFFMVSCKRNMLSIEIFRTTLICNLPSASGIASFQNVLYAIGDDSPFLFRINKNSELISKLKIYSNKNLREGRISKMNKPDFEAIEIINENEIVVIGSGSKSPERDVFLRVFLEDETHFKKYNITPFYDNLRKSKLLKNEHLNIEGLAFKNGYLHLFNRGKNIIFSFKYKDLIAYFECLIPFPEPITVVFNLPKINGIESGFSGATFLKNEPFLFFTSSVENTDNPYNDGEILGSFIGIINFSENKFSGSYDTVLIPNIEKPLKVESITVTKEIKHGTTEVALVTDDDKGKSIKIDCIFKFN